ncbi:uncharacterized protein LOC124158188 [Ischnura elegans]|uniref:uncharacterized protein LOC124158188 n=1 Tax=Ischnura elegans TaxID=197161 RepID=UPI001ED89E75|nr:uncharacterized protein LOC124158188 [Ischnura elegans]
MESSVLSAESEAHIQRHSLPSSPERPAPLFRMLPSQGRGRNDESVLPNQLNHSASRPCRSSVATALLHTFLQRSRNRSLCRGSSPTTRSDMSPTTRFDMSPTYRTDQSRMTDQSPIVVSRSHVSDLQSQRFPLVFLLVVLLSSPCSTLFPAAEGGVPRGGPLHSPRHPNLDSVPKPEDVVSGTGEPNMTTESTSSSTASVYNLDRTTVYPSLDPDGLLSLPDSSEIISNDTFDLSSSPQENVSSDRKISLTSNHTALERSNWSSSEEQFEEEVGGASTDPSSTSNHSSFSWTGSGEWGDEATDSPGGILLDPGGNETLPIADWVPSGGYFSRMTAGKYRPSDRQPVTGTERTSNVTESTTTSPQWKDKQTVISGDGRLKETDDNQSGSETVELDANSGTGADGMVLEEEGMSSPEHREARDSHVLGTEGYGGADGSEVVSSKVMGQEKEGSRVWELGAFPRRKIAILGLFEMTTKHGERLEGRSEEAAARLAIRHINDGGPARGPLIPGFELELLTNDTKMMALATLALEWTPSSTPCTLVAEVSVWVLVVARTEAAAKR